MSDIRGPVDTTKVPRYAGPPTFALLPRRDDVAPLTAQQVADAGDIACNPFDIKEAVDQIEAGAEALLGDAGHLLAIGGDHT